MSRAIATPGGIVIGTELQWAPSQRMTVGCHSQSDQTVKQRVDVRQERLAVLPKLASGARGKVVTGFVGAAVRTRPLRYTRRVTGCDEPL